MATDSDRAPGAILIAEDSLLLLALLKDALLAHGVGSVVQAFPEAERLYADYERRLDDGRGAKLLVIDIQLPGEDGLSLGRRVRDLENRHEALPAPVVFFSSREPDDEIAAAVGECFPARYVQKLDDKGPAQVALAGALLMKRMLDAGG